LYVWDDEAHDFQVITIASPDVIIYERTQARMGMLKGTPIFAKVTASNKLYNYFWGESYVANLAKLQDWRTEETFNVRNLSHKQADPPASATGAGLGVIDEKLAALRMAGGRATIDAVGAKVEFHSPKMPENMFGTISEIDNSFGDSAGIGHVLQGKGEAGVRSRGQTDVLARLGSARVKKTAVVVEECAEDVATIMFRTMQEHSDQRFHAEIPGKADAGLQFTAAQFTVDFELKVDAHSSSPIFVEDHKLEAKEMLELHVIDRETFLDITNPPNVQMLKERLKLIEAKEAKAAEMQMAAEAQKHGGGRPAQG
jgi:hypothetical protein